MFLHTFFAFPACTRKANTCNIATGPFWTTIPLSDPLLKPRVKARNIRGQLRKPSRCSALEAEEQSRSRAHSLPARRNKPKRSAFGTTMRPDPPEPRAKTTGTAHEPGAAYLRGATNCDSSTHVFILARWRRRAPAVTRNKCAIIYNRDARAPGLISLQARAWTPRGSGKHYAYYADFFAPAQLRGCARFLQ